MNRQQQNHRLRTDSSLSHWRLECILLVQIFDCVKTQTLFGSNECFLTYATYQHRETILSNQCNDHITLFILVHKVKICHTKFLILRINQDCAETLQVISFQTVSFVLHRRTPSKGTLIPKTYTFYNNIKYSTGTLPNDMFDCLKMSLNVMI